MRTLPAPVKYALMSMLALLLVACPSEPQPPPPKAVQPKPDPVEGGHVELGPLKLTLPGGFGVLQQGPNTLLMRHISDLTVTIGISGKTDEAKDEKTINAFLATAETELGKLTDAKVSRETRTLPNSTRVLRGVVAHTIDRRGTPVAERREMWVLTDGPAIITTSFIFIEGSPSSTGAVDATLQMLRDSIEALTSVAK
jgi:hypothetical protein